MDNMTIALSPPRAPLDTSPTQPRPSVTKTFGRGSFKRATAATTNSFKRLFKSKCKSPLTQPTEHGISSKDYFAQNPPSSNRSSSRDISRNSRTSTSKRITLRTSMLFRNHRQQVVSPRSSTHLTSIDDSEHTMTRSAPNILQQRRHNSTLVASTSRHSRVILPRAGAFGTATTHEDEEWYSSAPSVQKLRRCPPTNTISVVLSAPPLINTAAATPEHDSEEETSAKSPTSFSSQSLGLNSLDFGYEERKVTGLLEASMTSSPQPESLYLPSPPPQLPINNHTEASRVVQELGSASTLYDLPHKGTSQKLRAEPLDVSELVRQLGIVVEIDWPAAIVVPHLDIQSLVRQLGRCMELPAKPILPLSPPPLNIPDVIAELGGVYQPDSLVYRKQVPKPTTQIVRNSLVEGEVFFYPTSMDVDEIVLKTPIPSPNQLLHSILRLSPIMVSRPLMGPRSSILLPNLY